MSTISNDNNEDWEVKVHTLNVGQGDCSIIETWKKDKEATKQWLEKKSEGMEIEDVTYANMKEYAQSKEKIYHAVLIDGGPKGNGGGIFNFIQDNNIRITKILITHSDGDHWTGTYEMMSSIFVYGFWTVFLRCLEWIEINWGNEIEKDKEELKVNFELNTKIAIFLYIHCFYDESIKSEPPLNEDILFGEGDISLIEWELNDELKNIAKVPANKIFNKRKKILNKTKKTIINKDVISSIKEFILIKKSSKKDWKALFLEQLKGDECFLTKLIIEDELSKSKENLWYENYILSSPKLLQKKQAKESNEDLRLISLIKRKLPLKPFIDIQFLITENASKYGLSVRSFNTKIKGSMLGQLHSVDEDAFILADKYPVRFVKQNIKVDILGENKLGKNIFEFNTERLKKKQEQIKQEQPGLYLTTLDGKNYDFNHNYPDQITPTNASSIATLLIYKNFTYLSSGDLEDLNGSNITKIGKITGKNYWNTDLESLAAKNLAENGGYNNISIMKIGHHGAAASTSNFILNQLNPKNVIISCGSKDQHGHPTRAVLFRLHNYSSVEKIYLINSGPRYGVKDSWNEIKRLIAENPRKEEPLDEYLEKIFYKQEKYKDKINKETSYRHAIKFIKNELWPQIKDYYPSKDYPNFLYNYIYNNKEFIPFFSVFREDKKDKKEKKEKKAEPYDFNIKTLKTYDVLCIVDKTTISGNKTLTNNLILVEKSSLNFSYEHSEFPKLLAYSGNMKLSRASEPVYFWQDITHIKKLKTTSQIMFNRVGFDEEKYSPLVKEVLERTPYTSQIPELIDNSFIDPKSKWTWKSGSYPFITFRVVSFKATEKVEALAYLLINDLDTGLKINFIYSKENLSSRWIGHLIKDKENQNKFSDIISKINLEAQLPFFSQLVKIIQVIFKDGFDLLLDNFNIEIYSSAKEINNDYKTSEALEFNFHSFIEFSITTKKHWKVFEKLSINQIGLSGNIENQDLSLGFFGDFVIANKEIQVFTSINNSDEWNFNLIAKKAQKNNSNSLPSFRELGKYFIANFQDIDIPFLSNPNGNSKFDCIINQVQLRLNLNNSKSKIKELAVNTSISLKCFEFEILYIIYPYFKMRGLLSKPVSFKEILNSYSISSPSESLKNLTIETASFSAEPVDNNYYIDFDLSMKSAFNVGNKTIDLENIFFSLGYDNGDVDASLKATLLLKKATNPKQGCNDLDYDIPAIFNIQAELVVAKEINAAYWAFSGDLTGDIALREFIDKLKTEFGFSKELPDFIYDLHLNHAGIAFDTKGNLSFEIGLGSSAEDLEEESKEAFNFQLSLTREASTSQNTTWKSTGDLWVNGLYHFHGEIEKSIENQKLELTWDAEKDNYLSLLDMIAHFGFDKNKIPQDLDVQLHTATLTYNKEENRTFIEISATTTSSGKALFVSLSQKNDEKEDQSLYYTYGKIGTALSLSKLPVVGKQIAPIGEIAIKDLKIALASDKVNKDDEGIKKQLISILPSDLKITEISEKLSIDGKLDIAGNDKPIHLKILDFKEKSSKLYLQEEDSDKKDDKPNNNLKWFPVQKVLGPIAFKKIGFRYNKERIWFLLEAGLAAGGLTIDILGLGVGIKTNELKDGHFDPTFQVDGMSLSYHNTALSLAGEFYHQPKETLPKGIIDSYTGAALLQTKAFSLELIGQYAILEGDVSSVFLFGKLGGSLGGPPSFTIDALGASIGYNSQLRIPEINKVDDFPFVKALQGEMPDLVALTSKNGDIEPWITPKAGVSWFAVGIQFNTYRFVDSTALLTGLLGEHFELYLLGVSKAVFKGIKKPFANIEMGLKASFKPAEGFIGIDMRLNSNSYVIDPACKLTGGLAMYTWFSNNDHSGDYVLTIGGYNPKFDKTLYPHYPTVPRVGFTWKVFDGLNVSGGAYFAMTPKEMMAGYFLKATYEAGKLKAWFSTSLDALIQYKPFYYEVDATSRLGASYTFGKGVFSKTISIEIGADIHFWGPPTGVEVTFHIWKFSFTIEHSKRQDKPELANFYNDSNEDFISMLGKKGEMVLLHAQSGLKSHGKTNQADKLYEYRTDKELMVTPDNFSMSIESALPITRMTINENVVKDINEESFTISNLRGGKDLKTTIEVNITGPTAEWKGVPLQENLPTALWLKNDASKDNTMESFTNKVLLFPEFHEPEAKGTIHTDAENNILKNFNHFPF